LGGLVLVVNKVVIQKKNQKISNAGIYNGRFFRKERCQRQLGKEELGWGGEPPPPNLRSRKKIWDGSPL